MLPFSRFFQRRNSRDPTFEKATREIAAPRKRRARITRAERETALFVFLCFNYE
jgi:hypothetical protein